MIILFGWSFKTEKTIGPARKQHCPICNREEFHILHRESRWFTLFFVPVVPYEHHYTLYCPFCKHTEELPAGESKKLKPLAELHRAFMIGELHEQIYRNKVLALDPHNEFYDGSIPSQIVTCPYCDRELMLNGREIEERRFICPLCHKAGALVD
jgi:uncharacterized protein YbaR (Trm112 family)